MIRIETTQGTLARRGFVDAEAAVRVIDHWDDEHEPLLDLLAQSGDPDQALAGLDRLCDRVPGLLSRLTAAPILAHQLIMVLGASNRLTHHLIAHPEHIELLESELVKVPAASLRQELLQATGADAESPLPIGGVVNQPHHREHLPQIRLGHQRDAAPRPRQPQRPN